MSAYDMPQYPLKIQLFSTLKKLEGPRLSTINIFDILICILNGFDHFKRLLPELLSVKFLRLGYIFLNKNCSKSVLSQLL